MSAIAQRSFAGGEIAPALYARTDQQKYATGLRTCRNMMVQKHGGVTNRPGTEFLKEVKNSANAVRLVRFERSAEDTFMLEFGSGYIRFYQLGEQVAVGAVTPWSAVANYVVGDLASSGGVNYYAIAASLNQLPPNAAFWYPLTGSVYEIPTPYASGDLPALQFAQSIDTITIVHPSYAPRELTRIATTDWTLTLVVFAPAIATPANMTIPSGGGVGDELSWAVTAIRDETYEESLPRQGVNFSNHVPSEATPTTIGWDAVAGARGYNVYRSHDFGNSYGLVGTANTNAFVDAGIIPNFLIAPPSARDPFNAAGKYPSAVTYSQQRRIFAHSNQSPETVWGSRTGQFTNFTTSFPLQDDDAITFTLIGKRSSAIQHLLELGKRLIVFTSGEEKLIGGDEAGILRPDAINPQKISANGSGLMPPVEIDDSAIYVQARGTIIRDLKPIQSDSYEGTDLTVFAAHLFQKYTLVDWDYALNPNSIVWVARSDGTLLGLTYLREHAIWGWHRHDTDGEVENVCVVPEGNEDKVYLVVRRTINGSVKRYIERMATRTFTDETRAIFMDACYPSDLPSANPAVAYTVTLTGGVVWDETELLTVTKTVGPAFTAGDVGNWLFITAADGTEIQFMLENFTDATHMTGHARQSVPAGLRALATSAVIKGTAVITGLAHLEGKAVAVYADGFVVASPNNPSYALLTVAGGQVTLDQPYKFVRVGLPYTSDVVTLDIDMAGSQTIKDRKLLANRLGIYIEESRGIWAGMPDLPTDANPLNGLQEYKAREAENYSDPVATKTDFIEVTTEARWDTNGRQLIRQVDPLPLTVLSITPIGYL